MNWVLIGTTPDSVRERSTKCLISTNDFQMEQRWSEHCCTFPRKFNSLFC